MIRHGYFGDENVYLSCTWDPNRVIGILTSLLWIVDAAQLGIFAINVLISTDCTFKNSKVYSLTYVFVFPVLFRFALCKLHSVAEHTDPLWQSSFSFAEEIFREIKYLSKIATYTYSKFFSEKCKIKFPWFPHNCDALMFFFSFPFSVFVGQNVQLYFIRYCRCGRLCF